LLRGSLVVTITFVMGGVWSPAPATAGVTPPPDGTHVDVNDSAFAPSELSIARGGTLIFDFVGASLHHTATDGTGMNLYDSGSVGPGEPSTWFTFDAAGTYQFTCTPHPWMGGRVSVPISVTPRHAGPHRTFEATWATQTAPAGFVYDVHFTRRGEAWTPWQVGVAAPGSSFTPPSGRGIYRFRARMRGVAGGRSSWSEASFIRVV
jgi:plastocyanin